MPLPAFGSPAPSTNKQPFSGSVPNGGMVGGWGNTSPTNTLPSVPNAMSRGMQFSTPSIAPSIAPQQYTSGVGQGGSTTSTPTPGTGGQFQNLGGWNPLQYATDQTTQNLINQYGGMAGKTAPTSSAGPYVPQQNVIDFGGGYTPNAGLMQNEINLFGQDRANQMFADEARGQASGYPLYNGSDNSGLVQTQRNLGLGTNPALAGYDPSLAQPLSAGVPSAFGNITSPNAPGAQAGYTQLQSPYATSPTNLSMPTQTPNPGGAFGGLNLNSLMGLIQLLNAIGFSGGGPSTPQAPQPLAPQYNYYGWNY